MKISHLLSLSLLLNVLPLQATSLESSSKISNGAHADPGVINKERILYWLEKRGELAAQATDEQKNRALANYLANKSFSPKVLSSAFGKKASAAKRFNSREIRENILLNKELKKNQIARSLLQSFPAAEVKTTVKILAVLVDFNDLKHDANGLAAKDTDMFYDSYPASHYNELLFSDSGFNGPSGNIIESAYQYYQHESGGQFFLSGQVNEWVTVANDASFYGGNNASDNDKNVAALVVEAVTQLVAGGLDLSEYDKTDFLDIDNDGNLNEPDGIIDHIMIFHASIGEEAGGGKLAEDAIWSHSSAVSDGAGQPMVIVGSEIKAYGYTINPIDAAPGVVVHEFGHDLGLPDEYDIDNSDIGAPISQWSVMASGSWLGSPAGSRPSAFSPWARDYLQARYQGNWINQQEVNLATLNSESFSLVSTVDHTAVNQIKVNLPLVQLDFPAAYEGEYQFYSNKGDMLENSMSFTVDLPAGASILSMFARWNIEEDYDYLQVLVNGTAIIGNKTKSGNPYYNGLGAYITGTSAIDGDENDEELELTFDISAYANQSATIKINYVTDEFKGGYGFVADAITITSGSTKVISLDGETENQATLSGFKRLSNKIDALPHSYYVQLRSHTSVDSRLENVGYDAGVLLWYRNDNIADNKVDEHAGELFIGVVDADQNLVKASDGSIKNSTYQLHDAAFGLNIQRSFPEDNHPEAVSSFSDADDYSSPEQPESGITLPIYGFGMNIDSQSSDSTNATITLTGPAERSDLAVSFSTSVNNLVVNFTSTATGGNEQYSYAWDFGDSDSSSEKNPSHTYDKAGTYSVILSLTDGSLVTTRVTQSVTVTATVVVVPPTIVKSSGGGGGGSVGFGLLFGLCLLRRTRG